MRQIGVDRTCSNRCERDSERTFAVVVRQGLVHEVGALLKEGTEVELLGVVGLDPAVRDARAGVEIHAGVDVHEGGALGHVEDVRHAEFLQTHDVLGHEPAGYSGSEGRKKRIEAKSLERRSSNLSFLR